MARLELDHLVKSYGRNTEAAAVKDLSLEVEDGEFVCLLGPSGCGKTTTLRMIGGFLKPDSGDVRIDGTSIVRDPPERRPTAMVFQRYALWPHMRVWDNVAFGLQVRRRPRSEISARVLAALELVGLQGLDQRYPAQLSGGQQQRVALARALVLEPRILLLDEPLSNLDAQLRVHMRTELTTIQRRVGITTVFVTHDQEEAMSIADRIAVMNVGVLEQLDTPQAVYARPATLFVATFIGSMNRLEARVDERGWITAGPFTIPPAEAAGPDGRDASAMGSPAGAARAGDATSVGRASAAADPASVGPASPTGDLASVGRVYATGDAASVGPASATGDASSVGPPSATGDAASVGHVSAAGDAVSSVDRSSAAGDAVSSVDRSSAAGDPSGAGAPAPVGSPSNAGRTGSVVGAGVVGGAGGAARLVAGIRPEDLVLEQRGAGVPARIESDIDLGHYRRITLAVEGASLLAFVPKADPVPHDGVTVRPTRVLLYADGRLAGVSHPQAAPPVRA